MRTPAPIAEIFPSASENELAVWEVDQACENAILAGTAYRTLQVQFSHVHLNIEVAALPQQDSIRQNCGHPSSTPCNTQQTRSSAARLLRTSVKSKERRREARPGVLRLDVTDFRRTLMRTWSGTLSGVGVPILPPIWPEIRNSKL